MRYCGIMIETGQELSVSRGGIDMSRKDYGERLKNALDELDITENELAEAVGCCTKTISRYILGDKPNEQKKIKIAEYLDQKRVFGKYHHIPSEAFGKKVGKLLNEEFKGVMTETKLAENVGLKGGNSQISKIIYGSKKINTELQFRILDEFLNLCYKTGGVSFFSDTANIRRQYYRTAKSLYKTLYGDTEPFDTFEKYDKNNKESEYNIIKTLVNYFARLPSDAQDLILSAPLAFFDSMSILYLDYDDHYVSAEEFIEVFHDLPGVAPSGSLLDTSPRKAFQHELEMLIAEKKVLGYFDFKDNWQLFDIVTQYRAMIKSARERRIADPSGAYKGFGERIDGFEPISNYSMDDLISDKVINRREQIKEFENTVTELNFGHWSDEDSVYIIDTVRRDIEYRLLMSSWDWYMWMLYASYVFCFQEDDAVLELLKKHLHEAGSL